VSGPRGGDASDGELDEDVLALAGGRGGDGWTGESEQLRPPSPGDDVLAGFDWGCQGRGLLLVEREKLLTYELGNSASEMPDPGLRVAEGREVLVFGFGWPGDAVPTQQCCAMIVIAGDDREGVPDRL
jgi:hypothetical protein